MSILADISANLQRGKAKIVKELVQQAVDQGIPAKQILEEGLIFPILFRSYAIYTQRGSFRGLTPARDNLFFYHLGVSLEEALVTE